MWRGTCCKHRPAAPGSARQTDSGTAASALGSAGLETQQDGSELVRLAVAVREIAVVAGKTAVLGYFGQVVEVVLDLIGQIVEEAGQSLIQKTVVEIAEVKQETAVALVAPQTDY